MANDRELERNIHSARQLLKLLISIQDTPSAFLEEQDLHLGLSTQLSMGKICNPKRSIHPSSMSTLKRVSNKYIRGGFAELDAHRKKALSRLNEALKGLPSNPDSRAEIRKAKKNQKQQIQKLLQDQFIRDAVIFKLSHLLVNCAKSLESPSEREYYLKCRLEELYRLGFKGSNIDER